MNNPKITVLMSAYNAEKYLAKAMESILNQTCQDFEFIIINDCSTDKTVEILKSYGDKIKVSYNETNQGITANVNKLALNLDSDYIVLIGHDDKLAPNHVELMLSEFDEDSVFVHCNSIVIDSDGNEVKISRDDR
jgi:glycosyltransferase involved in cell wall biosynthesis